MPADYRKTHNLKSPEGAHLNVCVVLNLREQLVPSVMTTVCITHYVLKTMRNHHFVKKQYVQDVMCPDNMHENY